MSQNNPTATPHSNTIHYLKTPTATGFDVTGPGLNHPRHYPTEKIADEAIALFESVYSAGYMAHVLLYVTE